MKFENKEQSLPVQQEESEEQPQNSLQKKEQKS